MFDLYEAENLIYYIELILKLKQNTNELFNNKR